MKVGIIEPDPQITRETQVQTTETIRQKDEGQIVIIDKIHRAIGMIEMIEEDRTMIEIALHTEEIQVITATVPRTGEMTIVIIMTVQTIATAKINDMNAILVTSRTDDTTHRMTSEVLPHTEGTTIIPIHNVVQVHIRTYKIRTLLLCQNRGNLFDRDLQVLTQVKHIW